MVYWDGKEEGIGWGGMGGCVGKWKAEGGGRRGEGGLGGQVRGDLGEGERNGGWVAKKDGWG